MSRQVIKAALLGLGTVGTGVYKVLRNQENEMEQKLGAKVELKKILVRNLKKQQQKSRNRNFLPITGRKFWRMNPLKS